MGLQLLFMHMAANFTAGGNAYQMKAEIAATLLRRKNMF